MATGKCLKCDKIDEMTTEHIFPQWAIKVVNGLGLASKIPQVTNTVLICKECNQKKGGAIDYSHEFSRNTVKMILEHWITEIRKHEDYHP